MRDCDPVYDRYGVKMRKPRNEHMSAGLPAESRHCSARSARQKSANSGCEQSQQKKLLDHLVGGDKQPRWHGQAERTLGDSSSN